MDLGFGAVLEKFEEYFGRRTTKALLVLIGLGVAAVCLGAVWEWLVAPILALLQSPQWGTTITSLVFVALSIGGGVSIGLSLTAALSRWRSTRQLRRLTAETRAEADEMFDETRELLEGAADSQAKARAMMQATILLARALIGQDKTLSDVERAEKLVSLGLAQEILDTSVLDEVNEQEPSVPNTGKIPK